jgi:hypothetical protein
LLDFVTAWGLWVRTNLRLELISPQFRDKITDNR